MQVKLSLIAGVALMALGTSGAWAQAQQVVKIGTVGPISGPQSQLGKDHENGVRMESSSCKNQICVKQGTISLETADELALGRWIICLPNGVSVELSEDGS